MTLHDLAHGEPGASSTAAGLRHDLRHGLATVQALVAAAGDPRTDADRSRALLDSAGSQVSDVLDLLEEFAAQSGGPAGPRRRPLDVDGGPDAEHAADVEAVLRSATRGAMASGRAVSLECTGSWRVGLSRPSLVRVVGNLLRNALTATGPAGTVVVRAVGTGAGHVRVEVHDDGPGQPPGGFSRPGGIGLSVVRSLVLPAGGWLVLGRSPHGGACAAVTLPVLTEGARS